MKNQIIINGEWAFGIPTAGERYRVQIPVGDKFGYQEGIYQEVDDIEAIELAWCESELHRIEVESINLYKAALNKYKTKLDGDRPKL